MSEGKSTIKAMETETLMQMVGNPQLEPIGREVKQRMQRVIAKVAGA
jgi:hypothetical protein